MAGLADVKDIMKEILSTGFRIVSNKHRLWVANHTKFC